MALERRCGIQKTGGGECREGGAWSGQMRKENGRARSTRQMPQGGVYLEASKAQSKESSNTQHAAANG